MASDPTHDFLIIEPGTRALYQADPLKTKNVGIIY